MVFSGRVPGRLAGCMGCCLLPPVGPSQILPVTFTRHITGWRLRPPVGPTRILPVTFTRRIMGWRLLPPVGPSQILPVSFRRHIMGWHLLPPFRLSPVLPVGFPGQQCVPYQEGTSCCETTHASGSHCAWPRRVVSVTSSLTQPFFLLRNGLGFRECTSEMNLKPR